MGIDNEGMGMNETTITDQHDAAIWASKFINNTSRHVFLTGKAGTGKTTFLRSIREYTHKNTIVAAPTGIAAINAGGVTLHSLLQLPFGAFIPDNHLPDNKFINTQLNTPLSLANKLQMHQTRRRLLQEMELLIIDEVSMLRVDLLDAIDLTLRLVRRKKNKPFGGVQILFIGDLFQLPPVVKEDEWTFLKEFYKTPFFFDARALADDPPVYVELQTVFRQADDHFIDLLNHFRDHCVSAEDISILNSRYLPDFRLKDHPGYIFLTTHNWKADKVNREALAGLDAKTVSFEARLTGEFNEPQYPVEFRLDLKKGAQVMFIKNDPSGEQQFFNGKIGTVTELEPDKIEVSFTDGAPPAMVERYIWENKKFTLAAETNEIEEKVIGTFSHYPLKLAWAITVHKSQGLTFEKAVIDVADAFAPGQIYVALSRLVSLEGLVLSSRIPSGGPAQDGSLASYVAREDDASGLAITLHKETIEYIRETVTDAFHFSALLGRIQYYCGTYTKDEKKSSKQLYKGWALGIRDEVIPLSETGIKFSAQIRKILYSGNENYLSVLSERVTAAKNYFGPRLSGLSDHVFTHLSDVQKHPKSKTYQSELKLVEQYFFKQKQLICKADALIQSVLQNQELSRNSTLLTDFYKDRQTLVVQSQSKEKKFRLTEKTSTREISFKLFSEGKSIDEIAAERGLVRSTIEGHLTSYVATGHIPIKKLVSEEKMRLVEQAATELETNNLGVIRDHLGDAVSYGELRFIQAYRMYVAHG